MIDGRDERLIDAAAFLLTGCAIFILTLRGQPVPAPAYLFVPPVDSVALSLAAPPPPTTQLAAATLKAAPQRVEEVVKLLASTPMVRSAIAPLPPARPGRKAKHPGLPKPGPGLENHPSSQSVPMRQAQDQASAKDGKAAKSSAEARYLAELHATIERHKSNPTSPLYRVMHPHGTAVVAFSVSRDGVPGSARVLSSSGAEILDLQARLIVAQCRFPPIPDELYPGAAAHEFQYSITFPPPEGVD